HTIPAHGGTLVDLMVPDGDAPGLTEEAGHFPKLRVSRRELSDLEMLAVGALSPLTGFQPEEEYRSILESMHLATGLPWTIPVTLSIDDDELKQLGRTEAVTLLPQTGEEPLAVLEVEGVYKRDRETEAVAVFGTTDLEHPGVRALHDA